MTRRTFCSLTAAASASLARAAAAPPLLGINTYCLRAFKWPDSQLLDYCGSLKLNAVFLQDSPDPRAMEPAHWPEVKAQASRLGMRLFTGGGSLFPKTPADTDASAATLRTHAERASALGSPLVRFNLAGQRSALPPGTTDFYVSTASKLIKSQADTLRRLNVKVALEVHKDLQAWEFKLLLDEVGRDLVGIYFDPTNPLYVAEHPLTTWETLRSYVLTVHLGDACVFETPKGIYLQRVPLGKGILPLKTIVAEARQYCPEASIHVKTICGRPPEPVAIHTPEFWKPMPQARSADLSRFVALARSGGPFEGTMVTEDVAGRTLVDPVLSAVRAQQKVHIEDGLAYARKDLGLAG